MERTMSATWWTRPIRRTVSGRCAVGGVAGIPAAYPVAHDDGGPGQRCRDPGPAPCPARTAPAVDDFAAGVGVPAHVTLLFPFMPAAALTPPVRRALAEIAASVEPFDVRFATVGRFPGIVYLVPEPGRPFTTLTDAIAARFPAYQPYEGAFDEVIPHLTLVESATAPLDKIADAAQRHLPFTHRVDVMEVLVEGPDARWRGHWRIPFGRRR